MRKHTVRPLTLSSAVGAGAGSVEGPAPGVSVCQGSGGGGGSAWLAASSDWIDMAGSAGAALDAAGAVVPSSMALSSSSRLARAEGGVADGGRRSMAKKAGGNGARGVVWTCSGTGAGRVSVSSADNLMPISLGGGGSVGINPVCLRCIRRRFEFAPIALGSQ